HTFRAAEKFKVDPRDILVELGKRKTVGGQEDLIIEVAYQLSQFPK
ncbi:MAG: 4-hydroxy-2-oxovalerate aldolase, partial [Bacillota bacterium]